jgi:hypothetical protein
LEQLLRDAESEKSVLRIGLGGSCGLLSNVFQHGRYFTQSIGPDVAPNDSGAVGCQGKDDVRGLDAKRFYPPAD